MIIVSRVYKSKYNGVNEVGVGLIFVWVLVFIHYWVPLGRCWKMLNTVFSASRKLTWISRWIWCFSAINGGPWYIAYWPYCCVSHFSGVCFLVGALEHVLVFHILDYIGNVAGNNTPNWLISFRWILTTNQFWMFELSKDPSQTTTPSHWRSEKK